jgi:hypothetical protein
MHNLNALVICDGGHRLIAALCRGDEEILVREYMGDEKCVPQMDTWTKVLAK